MMGTNFTDTQGVEYYRNDDGTLQLIKAHREIETYTVLEGTVEIGDGAFECSNLKQIELPDSLKKIGFCAFSGCFYLENVILPSSLEVIETMAFKACTKLTTIEIPESVHDISDDPFYGCCELTVSVAQSTICNIDENNRHWNLVRR